MQQVLQPINGGGTEVAEIPAPICGPHEVLIANHCSLISAGTERSTLQLAKTSLLQKARRRPDHVRRVLEKVRQEGLLTTVRQVRAKLEQPMPLGYSSAGVVVEVGDAVQRFHVGDRVASSGPHAELVAVGENLVAAIPGDVPFDRACYAVVGAIALQGVRLARVGLGDVVAVIGLGLIGQITVALLRSCGCQVLGTDLDAGKRRLAESMGATATADGRNFAQLIASKTNGQGADAVLITASSPSNQPIETAAVISRQKGRIVAVGAVGMSAPRREFYPKELEFVVSCSYGPGRYDAEYEQHGRDYPYAYVRWTEQRNIQAVLDLMSDRSSSRLPVELLTTHRFSLDKAVDAYALVESTEPSVGILLEYSPPTDGIRRRVEMPTVHSKQSRVAAKTIDSAIGISLIGAGGFASSTLAPTFARNNGFRFVGMASAGGVSAKTLASKYKFEYAASDVNEVFADPRTSAVAILTRHHLHAPMGLAALKAGKHLFLEKPLVISDEQLEEWIDGVDLLGEECPIWTVGFNRRFSPGARLIRESFADAVGPKNVFIRFNAGKIPPDHWVHDPEVGGGRIIGEACHAIDLATYLIGSPPIRVHAAGAQRSGRPVPTEDDVSLTFRHADGSVSTILYTASGDRSVGKERIEMYGDGRTAVLDDFRRLDIVADGRRRLRKRWWSQEKGYAEEAEAFKQSIITGQPPIPYSDLIAVTMASLRAVQSLRLESVLDVA